MSGRVIVVDTETTGLDHEQDFAVEVAWQDYATGETGCFVPAHDPELVLAVAHPTALEVNGYRERIMHRPQDDGTEVDRLHDALDGATVVGSAPALDGAMLAKLFLAREGLRARPWHHRVVDLGSYAAGVLGLPLDDVQGLWWLSGHLGVERPDHGALTDVRSTVACLRALEVRRYSVPQRFMRHPLRVVAGWFS